MKIKLSKPKGKTKKMAKGEWRYQAILILTLIIMMYPIVYMIGTSFKTLQDIFSSGLNVFTSNPRSIERVVVATPEFTYTCIPNVQRTADGSIKKGKRK